MQRLTYKFPTLSLANSAANSITKHSLGEVVFVANVYVIVESARLEDVAMVASEYRGTETMREAMATATGQAKVVNPTVARIMQHKVPVFFVQQFATLRKRMKTQPGSRIMWSKDDQDLDVIPAKDVQGYIKSGWVIIENVEEAWTLCEKVKLTPDQLKQVNQGAKAKILAKKQAKKEEMMEDGEEEEEIGSEVNEQTGLMTNLHHPKGKVVMNKNGKIIAIYRTERAARKHASTGMPVKEEVEVAEAFRFRQQDWEKMRAKYKQGTPVNITLKSGKTVSGTLLRMDKYDQGVATKGHLLHVKTSSGRVKIDDVTVKSIQWNNDPKTKMSEETNLEEAKLPKGFKKGEMLWLPGGNKRGQLVRWEPVDGVTGGMFTVVLPDKTVRHVKAQDIFRANSTKLLTKKEEVEMESYGNPFTPRVPGTFASPNFRGGLKAGDKVRVPHKGKMVSGKIVRFDSGGTDKARQHGGGYVVDVGEPASILVPKQNVRKEEVEHIEEAPAGYALVVNKKVVYRGSKGGCARMAKTHHGGLGKGVFIANTTKDVGDTWEGGRFSREEVEIDEASWGGGFQSSREAQAGVQAGMKADAKKRQLLIIGALQLVTLGKMSKAAFKKLTGSSYDDMMKLPFYSKQVKMMKKEEVEVNEAMNNYIAFYNGKKMTVQAETSYKAQLKAAEMFKVPAKKQYMITVKLASNESVEHLDESATKAAIEDFMYDTLTKAAIAELKPIVKSKSSDRMKKIEAVLKKHKIPTTSPIGGKSAQLVADFFDSFHGESVELDESRMIPFKTILKGVSDMEGPFTIVVMRKNGPGALLQKKVPGRAALPAHINHLLATDLAKLEWKAIAIESAKGKIVNLLYPKDVLQKAGSKPSFKEEVQDRMAVQGSKMVYVGQTLRALQSKSMFSGSVVKGERYKVATNAQGKVDLVHQSTGYRTAVRNVDAITIETLIKNKVLV